MADQDLQALARRRAELLAALESKGAISLVIRSSALKRINETDRAITSCQRHAEELRQQLLLSRGRHDVILERALSLKSAEERRTLEQEMREVALAMRGSASGKGGMLD